AFLDPPGGPCAARFRSPSEFPVWVSGFQTLSHKTLSALQRTAYLWKSQTCPS
ncbi:hypothetical protein GOODEAATRI_029839, partial [Goodea atripinnis]